MAKLHIMSGAAKGHVFELIEDMVTVGRAVHNMICLPDESVSTYHATFIREGTTYRLRDLNSSNHTCINGSRISEAKLSDGDIIRFGDLEARFEVAVKIDAPAPLILINTANSTQETPEDVSVHAPPVSEQQTALSESQNAQGMISAQSVRIGVTLVAAVILGTLAFIAGRFWESHKTALQHKPQPPAAQVIAEESTARQPSILEMPVAPVPKGASTTTTNEDSVVAKDNQDLTMLPTNQPESPQAVSPEMPTNESGLVDSNKSTVEKEVSELSTNQPQPSTNSPAGTNAPAATVAPITSLSSTGNLNRVPATPAPATTTAPPTKTTSRITERPEKNLVPLGNMIIKVKPNPYESAGVLAAQTQVDQLVAGRLQRMGIAPASLCSDGVFVRRVYLDVIGTVPTAEEVRAFLEDRNPNKRNALIDRLLERDEFADYWAMKWCDLLRVKAEFPINLWPNAVQTYHQWIRTCLKENRPYDRFVRELLTSSGSNFREPPVNFYRAVQSKDPQTLAQTVALTFMGARAEKWPKEQLAGMAMFFSQVGYKSTAEWKEEIVFYDPSKATNATNIAIFPDGTKLDLPVGKDPRAIFANWLITPQNPWFTRNIVNRVWSWLLGRGIIHESDDIRTDNPPVNPELLSLLERELINNRYDLKSVYRLILKSRTYQLSAIPRSNDPRAEANFAFYPVRRLEAEVIIDAINQITGTTEKYSSPIPEPFTFIPESVRSIALADGSISSPFLDLFGRSSRATGMEAERNNRPTAAQQLHLLNSSHIQRKIEQSAKLKSLLQQAKGRPRGVVDALYLTILSRYPDDEEVRVINAYGRTEDLSQRAGLDLAWALINSTEFQHRH